MADTKFTPSQAAAIEAESGTILVAAAAGSGKTRVLTERVVRKLTGENAVDPASLLIVTFTKAAAGEMRERIIKAINKLMLVPGSDTDALARVLSRVGTMKICTMDSFCMDLVKTNFNRLGIDADVNVMDEGEEQALADRVLADVIEDMLETRPDTFTLLTEMFSKTGDDRGLSEVIKKLSKNSMSAPDPTAWLKGLSGEYECTDIDCRWTRELMRDTIEMCDYILAFTADFEKSTEEIDEKNALEREIKANKFSFARKTVGELRDALEAALGHHFTAEEWNSFIGYFTLLRETFADYKSRTGNRPRLTVLKDAIMKNFADKAEEIFAITAENHREDVTVFLPVVEALTEETINFNARLLEAKEKQHAYSFNDILHYALRLVYDPESTDEKTDFARELSREFSEIMIDEYQDTNYAQDKLFCCLSGGQGKKNMFMVGDVKQSIYGFRLADPKVFMDRCDSYPDYDGIRDESKILLRENFRCRKGIVEGVNHIFERLMHREFGGIEYDESAKLVYGATRYEQCVDKKSPDVNFRMILTEKGAVREEAEFIAKDILRKMKTEVVCDVDNLTTRPPRQSDFAIIMRSPSEKPAEYMRVFREYGLNLIAGKKTELYETAEVRLMLALIKAIDNPTDNVAMAAVMMSEFFGFLPDDLAIIRMFQKKSGQGRRSICSGVLAMTGESAEEYGNIPAKCRNLEDRLSYYRTLSQGMKTDELIRQIDRDFLFADMLSGGDESGIRHNNILLLAETAEAAASRGMKTTTAFIRYFDALEKYEVKTPGASSTSDGDCVKLISAHGSKGLEYPFVYVANTSGEFNKKDAGRSPVITSTGIGFRRRNSELLQLYPTLPFLATKARCLREELSEEMRIFYVALTRAREGLTIVCAKEVTNDRTDTTAMVEEIYKDLPCNGAITTAFLRNSSNPGVWFTAVFGEKLRCDASAPLLMNEGRMTVASCDCTRDAEDYIPETEAERVYSEEFLEKKAKALEAIRKSADRSLPYREVASMLSKYTASSADGMVFSKEKFTRAKPRFTEKDRKLTGAEKGTATHIFMECCDFGAVRADFEAELERIVSLGRLSPIQAQSLNRDAIICFANSDIVKEIEAADEVYREKRFAVMMDLSEFDKDVPAQYAKEKTELIGQLDLLYVKGDEAHIVDYKTDRIKSITELTDRYSEQMRLYINAVDMAMERKVKDCILYSLELKQFITIKAEDVLKKAE